MERFQLRTAFKGCAVGGCVDDEGGICFFQKIMVFFCLPQPFRGFLEQSPLKRKKIIIRCAGAEDLFCFQRAGRKLCVGKEGDASAGQQQVFGMLSRLQRTVAEDGIAMPFDAKGGSLL